MNAASKSNVRLEMQRLGLVDVAVGKQAKQSSYSPWSKTGEEVNALDPKFRGEFAFHTEKEKNPWWQVDIGSSYPIETIVISNRIGGFEERARTLTIQISENELDWVTVHTGFVRFGSWDDERPLIWCIGSDLQGRYVRLSLAEEQYLHLTRVEVLVRRDLKVFAEFCSQHQLPRYYLNENPTASKYIIEMSPNARYEQVVGLKINYSGRFGNLLHQYVNTIQIAQRARLKFIQLGRHELFEVQSAFSLDGITFFPADVTLPPEGAFLCGEFFNSDDFMPVLPPFLQFQPEDEREFTAVVQNYILPNMLTGIPLKNEHHPNDELTIHIRSGDIFELDHPMTYGYRQPPLSFYQMVVLRMRENGRINKVRMVFEDRGNPCINALEDWLLEQGVACRVSCGTLHEDMSALIDAPHLVFGHGTFGYAACRLSKRIETVHFFQPELGGAYGAIPTIEEVFAVSDARGEYIKAFEYGKPFGPSDGWRNTPEMRTRMLTYPGEFLHIEELKKDTLIA